MTRQLTYKDAVNEAIRLEMRADSSVILIGEDVAGGAGNETDMTCILPSRATAAAKTQSAIRMTLSSASERSPPRALLMLLPSVLPNANRLLPIVI